MTYNLAGEKRRFLLIAIPMIIQNLITNFVSMLDNIMIGQVSTAQMSGVSIANQFIFVFNITIFGGISGAGIFGAQYYGKEDHEGQKYTFRFRLLLSVLLITIFAVVFNFFGQDLIRLFLSGDDSPQMIEETLKYGNQYLQIMIIGLIPFGIGQAYSSVVRECGESKIPMYGSVAAIGVNLMLDYGLIFGKLGMPKMGVAGAAIATVIAKFIEAAVVIVWAHTHTNKNKYIIGAFRSLYVPASLVIQIIKKGIPLLFNEFMWALGETIIAQSYSVKGIDVVAARNIACTLTNLFGVIFVQMGGAIGIVIGNTLGTGDKEKAKWLDRQLIIYSLKINTIVSLCLVPVAFIFPHIYNTEADIMKLSTFFILVRALAIPIWTYTNATYFTLRSGGKTGITFMFDFGYSWLIMIPAAFILNNFTSLDIHVVFAIVTYMEIIKVFIGHMLIKSGIWVNNLVEQK